MSSIAVRTPAPYLGGKRNLARHLVGLIGETPHRIYVEPFVGMGGIFLKRHQAAPAEVINDLSRDVATLFRILQRHFEAFMDTLKWQLSSRAEFERLTTTNPDTLTDLERAARFLYLQHLSFGGKVTGRNFGVSKSAPARFDVAKLREKLPEIHERLAGVTIECLPYADLIRRYDSAETMFYLDPPYWNCEADYGAGFERADFERLADQLGAIAGRFILSINDTPGARAVFARFNLSEIETTYTVGSTGAKRVGELIVRN